MTRDVKIGAGQLFSLLFLCRILTTVTFSPFLGDSNLDGDFFFNILFACLFIVVLSIIPIVFYKAFPSENPCSLIDNLLFSKWVSVFYSLVFFYFASVSVSRFFVFTTGIIFPEKNMNLFLAIAVLLCSYCAYLGIEAIARGNTVLLFIILIGVCVILFSVSDKFSVYNLEPLFYHSFSDSVESGLAAAGRTAEITAFMFLAPITRGKIKKSFLICLLCFLLSLLVLFLFLNGVSGEFAKTQLFPFYSLTVIADFPFFERLDAVATALWIFAILIKTSLFIYISGKLISDSFHFSKKTSIIICFSVICATSLLLSLTPGIHIAVCSPLITGILTIVSSFVIPAVLILKKGRGTEKI